MRGKNKIIFVLLITVTICLATAYLLLKEEKEQEFIDCENGFFVEKDLIGWTVHNETHVFITCSDKESAIYYAKYCT